jgi:RNA polymerase sigma-70 factor (ECF subfamily)
MIALLVRECPGSCLSDLLLVERVKERNDIRAFDEIVRRHKNRIFSYICRMTHDGPDAEDLTQEVFIRAYQSLHRFRADSAVDTWLYRIATNLVIDRFRRSRRVPQTWVTLDAEDDTLGELPATDRDSNPEAAAQLGELQREVHRAVQTLPPKLRTAVVLHDIEGLSYEEVAEALGCPVGTVKSRLFNGRNLLRRKLAHYVEADR